MVETGVVLTATELEGVAPASDWSLWLRSGRAPMPANRMPFAESWQEDIEQLASLGITDITVTLEWARLEPERGSHDELDVEFRRDLLSRCRVLGLRTWACLVDGTLPGWFADDDGGFGDDANRELVWPRHIDWIGERFEDVVDGWIPQREPLRWALRRYLRGTAPPGRRDRATAAKAVQAAMLAEGEAWRLLRGNGPVATFQTARPIRAAQALAGEANVKARRPHADFVERLLWHPWVTALSEGQLIAGDQPTREVEVLRGAFDRVIVQLRAGIDVDANGAWHGRPPMAESMAETLRRVADELSSIEITAAGDLAEVSEDGRTRPDHVQEVLALTEDAVAETSVVGWWQTSPIDGYQWLRGTGSHPGLIDQDRAETSASAAFRTVGSS